ncbi:SRPBCC family protein [Dyadobacter aurulentus]|uniref:SRPBCC family protein n=1 Tax=Dyadobacter sp. UC 10 TaxID=2605428 RepID=UPI0011F09EF2|nr:SRPBCC domain-containing protein [Dyadobacter sp. UC 10]KAA0993816.1 hypothetical protein FXO21_28355 [Dyadobacter sp. UC 10]
MIHRIVEKSIMIHVKPEIVWQVFTNARLTRQMGGEYVTDWKTGSAFGWKGLDGRMYTNGKILDLVPGKMIRHDLLNDCNSKEQTAVITYHFHEKQGSTLLQAREEIMYAVTEKQYREVSQGWNAALEAVKQIAEANNIP